MSSIYSTVINFSILGLLQHLHCIHIQNILEAEGEENGIVFQNREKHLNIQEKASTSQAVEAQDEVQDASSVNIEDIKCWIQNGKDKAN